MSGATVHSVTKFDLQQNNVKVTKGREDRSRPKKMGRTGPFRHWTVHSLFSRTASVGPMVDRVVTAVAYKHKDNKKSEVKVKDKVNVNVKVAERSYTALLRYVY